MKPSHRSLLAAAVLAAILPISTTHAKPSALDAADNKGLAAKIGKEVSVQGVVMRTAKGDKDGVRLLEFSDKEGRGFVAAVFPPAYKSVGPIKGYKGKTVRVTGVLEKYKKQTQIKVLKGSQLKVVEPAKKKS